jgi:hypothetical protein
MFLAGDRKEQREYRIRRYLSSDPGVALLLAAVNFEWTVSRAVLFLSKKSNSALREDLRNLRSLDGYKDLWKDEALLDGSGKALPQIVRNWSSVPKAFNVRNKLVHGHDRCTRNMALPHVEALLQAVGDIDAYCLSLGHTLHGKMPVRYKTHSAAVHPSPPAA